ncbi:tryptophan synthase beta subunit-like PLP-dependent enzyme [Pyronema omphalodes]|nr:tryptophan synthase beta subunit-like PLP-dependent enzyme [Pyronema omphalodes]
MSLDIHPDHSGDIYANGIYINPEAAEWTSEFHPSSNALEFHRRLPGYSPTPLISLPSIASSLGLRHLLIKTETSRFGLPAFKILGASFATFRTLCAHFNLPDDATLEDIAIAAEGKITLVATTDGNHGRAVAWMAKKLRVGCQIFVPDFVSQPARDAIAGEGAIVNVVEGDYDGAVMVARKFTEETENSFLIQDAAWDGYTVIPKFIVEGYTTMLVELDLQAQEQIGRPVDVVLVPVGVGSLAEAVTSYYKRKGGNATTIISVEPETAACLQHSLRNGFESIETSSTIMAGLCCGTVSDSAWPVLSKGVDVSTVVSDKEAHRAVADLKDLGINVGPCGGATLAGLRRVAGVKLLREWLGEEFVVAMLCTEGARYYEIPT